MKLLLCSECQDIIRLIEEETRLCLCGKSWGIYTDELNAEYGGKGIPLAIDNSSLVQAIRHQPKHHGAGAPFHAFVVPEECITYKKEE